MSADEPFPMRYDVAVPGGALHVARSGDPLADVVLAAHGVTASHLAWRAVARELRDEPLCLLAPDLRGRGRSAGLPGPYGLAAHVDDLLAVLDDAGVQRAVLLGHSMGGYVMARLAAAHPERVAALVMLDGGVPLPLPDGEDPEQVVEKVVGPALARLHRTYASREEYVERWRAHPAFAAAWNDDVERYAGYDVAGKPGTMRCVVSETAVRADSADVVSEEAARAALARVRAPAFLLRAQRGFLDEADKPFISADAAVAFATDHPAACAVDIPRVNHYTLTLGAGPGPAAVAAIVRAAMRHPAPLA